MTFDNYTIVMSGIGGQGLISLLQILGDSLMKKGYKITTAETHGLSQRGGKIVCFLRFGSMLSAPIPLIGTADVIIASEKSCIFDVLKYSKPDKSTKLVISTYEEKLINKKYPSEKYLFNVLHENSDNIYLIPATDIAEKLVKDLKTANIVILGYIVRFLPLNEKELENSLIQKFSEKILDRNLNAFKEGLKLK
ncbi:MAG: 2-oxoacid:acceptor oxidoreductase family protein [Candidatus Hermodarchaeota archaeon]